MPPVGTFLFSTAFMSCLSLPCGYFVFTGMRWMQPVSGQFLRATLTASMACGRLVVLDSDEDAFAAGCLFCEYYSGDDLFGPFEHDAVIAGDVRFALAAVYYHGVFWQARVWLDFDPCGETCAAHSDDTGFSDGEAYLLRGVLIEELSGVSKEVLRFRPGSFCWNVGVWFDDDGRASSQDGV